MDPTIVEMFEKYFEKKEGEKLPRKEIWEVISFKYYVRNLNSKKGQIKYKHITEFIKLHPDCKYSSRDSIYYLNGWARKPN